MLIKCPECELQVSDKALYCPHCGYPMKSNIKQNFSRKTNKRRRLPNGFGQISEIKGKNLRNPFRAMVTIGKTHDGKPICKPLKPKAYFQTYNDAYSALVEYNKNPYDLEQTMTIEELYEKWSSEYFKTLKSETSIRAIKSAWNYCGAVYNMRIIDIRARHIKGCIYEGTATIKGHQKHPGPFVKNKIKSLFNLMLDYALEYELVDKNYARTFNLSEETLKEITTVKKQHIAFSEDEISLLWQQVGYKAFVDLILIDCYSGWRPQELGLIEIRDVDLENWTFKGGMKTDAGKDRTVPIHSKIRPLVLQCYNNAIKLGSKYLFNNPKSNEKQTSNILTYGRYQTGFSRVRDELNLNPNHRPHDGRTHFVTMAKKYGVDEYAIKYIVGHNISDITERIYTKREFEWLREEIEKIK